MPWLRLTPLPTRREFQRVYALPQKKKITLAAQSVTKASPSLLPVFLERANVKLRVRTRNDRFFFSPRRLFQPNSQRWGRPALFIALADILILASHGERFTRHPPIPLDIP